MIRDVLTHDECTETVNECWSFVETSTWSVRSLLPLWLQERRKRKVAFVDDSAKYNGPTHLGGPTVPGLGYVMKGSSETAAS